MTCHLLEIFSEKLTHTLQRRESRCLDKKKPDSLLEEVEDTAVKTHHCPCYHGGHQTDMCTASDEISFEFSNASCQDVDDVISLENSSVPDCAVPESPIEEVPYPDVSDMNKDQSIVKLDPTQVYEEPYEPTIAIEVEKHDPPTLESGPEEQKAKADVSLLEKVAPSMKCMLENTPAVPGAANVAKPWILRRVSLLQKLGNEEKARPVVHEEADFEMVAASGPALEDLDCGFACAREETSYPESVPEKFVEPPFNRILGVTEGQVEVLQDDTLWDEAPPTPSEVERMPQSEPAFPVPEPITEPEHIFEAIEDVPAVDPCAGPNKKQKQERLAKKRRGAEAKEYAKREEDERLRLH
jgi:hypothetical protein